MMDGKIIAKYKVRIKAWWTKEGETSSIFDTEPEAKQYALMVGTDKVIEIREVQGVIGTQYVRTGMMTGKDVKAWVELSEEALAYHMKRGERRRKREEKLRAQVAV